MDTSINFKSGHAFACPYDVQYFISSLILRYIVTCIAAKKLPYLIFDILGNVIYLFLAIDDLIVIYKIKIYGNCN